MVSLLKKYLRPYKWTLVVIMVLLLVQAIANLLLPTLNADIINNGVVAGDIGYIWRLGGLMLAVTAAMAVAAIVATYFSARTAMAFGRDLRAAQFHRVQSFSLHEVNDIGAASLITRNTNDVQQVQMLVLMGLTMMIVAPIMAIGGVLMAIRLDVQLSALLIVVVPVMVLVIGLILRQAIPLFRAMQIKIDRINDVLRERLAGIRVIRAFVKTDYEQKRFAEANADLTDTALRVTRLFALMMPALMFIMQASSIAVLWFGGHLVNSGQMQIGDLTAYLQYLIQILFSVLMAVMLFVMVPRAAAASERIQEVLHTEAAISDPQRPEELPNSPIGITISFHHVGFRYPGAQDPVLDDINFIAKPGTVTAIVGGTGSGKTTLVNLIPRLYDISAGTIRFNGVDIRNLALQQVWSQLAIVPQRAFLFSGTVASNVRFGRAEATDAQVWQALETAQAAVFVRELPDLLQAPIDQGGANVSGGQRQRLAIARALIRKASVLILDDSFSALDYATDARLRSALRAELQDTTVLIVAQRVSTIMNADQILVLDDGKLIGVGTHDELLANCPTYAEIVASQRTVTA